MVALSELQERIGLVKFAAVLHRADQFDTNRGKSIRKVTSSASESSVGGT
jgi:hypothetical protein